MHFINIGILPSMQLAVQVNDKIMSKELELSTMTVVAEDDYAAMQQLVGLSAEMIKGFESLKQGLYSNVNVPVTDNLHVDPRVREFVETFRDKVGECICIMSEFPCYVQEYLKMPARTLPDSYCGCILVSVCSRCCQGQQYSSLEFCC